MYYGPEKADSAILRFIDGAKVKIDSCINSVAPSVIVEVDAIMERRVDAVKNRGLKLRYVIDITKDNLDYVKQMLTFSEIRHLDGMKGNFEVADQREYVAVATLQEAQPIPQLLFSNLPEIVEQQQFVFDSFWSRAIPAEHRIKEIEDGIAMPVSIVFSDFKDAVQKEFEMIRRAKREIQIMSLHGKRVSPAGERRHPPAFAGNGGAQRWPENQHPHADRRLDKGVAVPEAADKVQAQHPNPGHCAKHWHQGKDPGCGQKGVTGDGADTHKGGGGNSHNWLFNLLQQRTNGFIVLVHF